MSNYAINLAFLETYARESGYPISPRQLASMARPKCEAIENHAAF